MVDRSGQRLEHYKLVHLIGRGGFADVYLAQNLNLESFCAIKILRTPLIRKGKRQFLHEARLAARLDNQHIIRVLDASSHNGIPFIVMSYAPNGSLKERHPRGKPAPFDVILNYLEQIADALDYLSAQNLIHMDVKPENLLLGRNFEVLLSDFGISKSLHRVSSSVPGTPHYMSPEHLQGQPGPASDQYALAVCVYKWLTGYLPFEGTVAQIKRQHLQERPPSLRALASDIPPTMERVVLRALSKDPQRRYPSVGAFADAYRKTIPPAQPSTTDISRVQAGLFNARLWIADHLQSLLIHS